MKSQNIKEGIEGHPVEWYNEVFELVFPDLDRTKANACKVREWEQKYGKDESSSSSSSKREDDD